jgi:light-regulated signal transduction histidine kinase (bacteriophytochrome)
VARVSPHAWSGAEPCRISLVGLPPGALLVSETGQVLDASSDLAARLGHHPAALRGRRLEDVLIGPAPAAAAALGNALARTVRADGHESEVDMRASPVDTELGAGWLVWLAARAAPTDARLEVGLARAATALEELAYVTSHDLREPLRGIHAFATLLLEDHAGQLDDDGRRKLATLGRLSERMDGLLDALLDYARIARMDESATSVDMNAVVAETRASLATAAEARGAELHAQPDLPRIQCRRGPVARVLRELVRNAIAYTPTDAPRVDIGWAPGAAAPAALANGDGWPAFFVRDAGIGIHPDHHASIFRMFRRLHPRGVYGGGLGAGLAIVRRAVESHAASLWVDSAPGRGSTFWFTLGPRTDDAG